MNKKLGMLALTFCGALLLAACGASDAPPESAAASNPAPAAVQTEAPDEEASSEYESAAGKQLKVTAGDVELVVTLNGSRAAADLVELLPLELTLIEREGFAKGMTLPAHLSADEPTTREYQIGDFGYWDAGPDLAIFYDDLYEQTVVPVIPLGTVEENAAQLADASGTVTLELLEPSQDAPAASSPKILIAYFTVPETDGVDTVSSASRVATDSGVLGNTQFVAQEVQKNLGGDLFAIQTVQTYPESHAPLLEFAHDEMSRNARPALAFHIENLDDYDIILIGYPVWNADLPMPLYSFFDEYDFSGKTLIPFATHGGSGFADTRRTIQELEPQAIVLESDLAIFRNNVLGAPDVVAAWADSVRQRIFVP